MVGFLSAVFRLLIQHWLKDWESFQVGITKAVAELRDDGAKAFDAIRVKHDADQEAVWKEIQVIREAGHRQSQDTGILIGRLSNQVEMLTPVVAELRTTVLKLDKTVAVLTDRMGSRRGERREESAT